MEIGRCRTSVNQFYFLNRLLVPIQRVLDKDVNVSTLANKVSDFIKQSLALEVIKGIK